MDLRPAPIKERHLRDVGPHSEPLLAHLLEDRQPDLPVRHHDVADSRLQSVHHEALQQRRVHLPRRRHLDRLVLGLELGADDPFVGRLDVCQEARGLEEEALIEHVPGEGREGHFRGKDCNEDFHLALDLLINNKENESINQNAYFQSISAVFTVI